MKKIILPILLVLTGSLLHAQDDGVKLDLLRAPSSPASNLLGIATSDIDKPTDVSAFMLSLQSAAGTIGKIPSNYAVDIAPYYLFSKRTDLTTEGLRSKKFNDIFRQTLVLSAAIRNPDESETVLNPESLYAGFGFKFAIRRGGYDKVTTESLDRIAKLQDTVLHHLAIATRKWKMTNDPVVIGLRLQMRIMTTGKTTQAALDSVTNSDEYKAIEEELSERMSTFTENETAEIRDQYFAKIRKIASEFQMNRVGFTWEVNGGVSNEFRNRTFGNSKLYNAGLWTTLGYTFETGHAFLGLVRYLYNPDKVYALDNAPNEIANLSTLDAGVRYVFARSQSKFSASVEAVYRSVLTSGTIDPSWRFVFNADYAIWQNQKLTFSFGRNFDGTTSTDGNLIAALSFLTGFGNKR